ncbi:MAG: LysR substrate-binding domain-containing protein [Chitinophagales bacterium]
MTLSQLQYIIALDKHRHFSKAAERCNVTQPTLSIQIQKLEKELEIVIFDRTKNPVVPTQEGEQLLAQAYRVLEETKKLKNLATDTRTSISGRLRIAVLPSLAPYLLPLFIGSFLEKYPQVQLEVMELHNYQIFGRLRQDRADVAITVAPIEEEGFYEIPLFNEPIAVYLSPTHPLASKKTLAVEDVDLEECILTDDSHTMRQNIERLQRNKRDRKSTASSNLKYRSGSMESICRIIENYGGITLLPYLATLHKSDWEKQFVRYFENAPHREVIFLTQRGFEKQKLIDLLGKEIMSGVEKYF